MPRYTSYPTAPVFSREIGAEFQVECFEALDSAVPVSVYVHIRYCERLCWSCACRTQGTQTLGPVESYMGTLEAELACWPVTCRPGFGWAGCTGAAARRLFCPR